MQLSDQDAGRLLEEGIRALQQGRAAEARGRFEAATEAARESAQAWLLLAIACRAQEDAAAEERAIDQLLEIQPQALRGLIIKGDCRARADDNRGAADLYKNALRVGAEQHQSLQQGDLVELRRVEAAVRQLDASHAAHLESTLTAQGSPPETRSARFQHSVASLRRPIRSRTWPRLSSASGKRGRSFSASQ